MTLLTSINQFQALLDSQSDFIIYKHSSTCSISDKACRNVYQIVNELQLKSVYHLDVLNTGDLKYEVADLVGVRHESPQVLIFRGGKLIAHSSHGSITSGWFRQHLVGWNDTRNN